MDSKTLMNAAREGNVEILNKLLQENPSFVDDIAFLSLSESLLNVATKAGKVSFVRELMKHNPELARELNSDGFRALDIAAIMGNAEIAKELVRVDPEICHLKGKGRRNALHYASSKGKIEVIDAVVATCPDCLKDTTVHGETALHLAVKNYQFDAFKVLIKWVEFHKLQSIINCGDYNGNTVLHLAASTKQHESLELLLRNSNISTIVDVNGKNAKGLTAIDLFDIVMENPDDMHTREILHQAGAKNVTDASVNTLQYSLPAQAQNENNMVDNRSLSTLDWIRHFRSQAERDSSSDTTDTRNVLLVVAALIATVTFQAGLSPPSAVSASNFGLILFLFANTFALIGSTNIIMYLTGGFPFQRELNMSMIAMIAAYGIAVGSTPSGERTIMLQSGQFLVQVSFWLPLTLVWLPTYLKNAWKKCISRGRLLPLRR